MNITIFNSLQLQALSEIIRKGNNISKKLTSGEITFTFNIFEFLFNKEVKISFSEKDLLENKITFNLNDKPVIFYDILKNSLTDLSDSDNPETIYLSNNNSVDSYSGNHDDNSKKSFSYLLEDNSLKDHSVKSVEKYLNLKSQIFLIVFGVKL